MDLNVHITVNKNSHHELHCRLKLAVVRDCDQFIYILICSLSKVQYTVT